MSDVIVSEKDIIALFGDNEECRDFLNTMAIVNDIIDKPGEYTGVKAMISATKLAALRTRIGMYANWLKTGEKNLTTRRQKDLLLSLEANVLENINCLKLAAKVEGKATGLM